MSSPNIISPTLIQTPLLDKGGRLSFSWQKWFQGLQQAQKTVVTSFTPEGVVIAPLSTSSLISGRLGTLGSILGFLDAGGIMLSGGIDFSRVYLNQAIKYIADSGPNFPLAGGAAAYAALLNSGPTAGQVLVFNGVDWLPATLAAGGVTQIIAGTNVTVTPPGGTGAVTVNAVTPYLKGTVTIDFTGTSGTFTADATIAGAALGQAAILCDPIVAFHLDGTAAYVDKVAFVSAANTVTCSAAISGFAAPPGNITFPVVVFP